MRKLDIAKDVAEAAGLPLSDSLRLVELVLQLVLDTLVRGEPVMIAGFGKFSIREKRARAGRNPQTGEQIPITPRRVVQFRASPLLKQVVVRSPGLLNGHLRIAAGFDAPLPDEVRSAFEGET